MNSPRFANKSFFSGQHRIPAVSLAARLATTAGLLMLAACVSTQTLEAGENLVSGTPIGQEREAVITQSGDLAAAQAGCETVKTGVGVNRRAYFLETCIWEQPETFHWCGRQPESVEYSLLEGRLVAATFRFASGKEKELQACLHEQALAEGYSVDLEGRSAGQVTRLLNTTSNRAITMTDGSVVRLFDSEIAPKVHLLRDEL